MFSFEYWGYGTLLGPKTLPWLCLIAKCGVCTRTLKSPRGTDLEGLALGRVEGAPPRGSAQRFDASSEGSSRGPGGGAPPSGIRPGSLLYSRGRLVRRRVRPDHQFRHEHLVPDRRVSDPDRLPAF